MIENTAQLDGLTEGYIVEFADGQFFKFKSKRYLEISAMDIGLSFQNVVSALSKNEYEQFITQLPEEFIDQSELYKQQVLAIFQQTMDEVQTVFAQAPKTDKGTFAKWVQQHHSALRTYLFTLWDQQDLRLAIYKQHAFKNM